MKIALVFAVFAAAAAIGGLSTGLAEEADQHKFIMFDQAAFAKALTASKIGQNEKAGSFGIFIDGHYAGQIGDTIRVGDQQPATVKIVARKDGQSWSVPSTDKPANGKLVGLYGLQFDPKQSDSEPCTGAMAAICQDFVVEQKDKTAVLLFKPQALVGKKVALIDYDFGPRPGDDTKDIAIETEPAGAEIYLDDKRLWRKTNVTMSIPFAKDGNIHLPRSVTLRLADKSKSSGVVKINYETNSILYKFETGKAEIK